MQAVQNSGFVTVEEYLALEQASDIKHEYIGGRTYAMAGASQDHNRIAGNVFASLHSHLRGKPCQVFIADLKVRLQIAGEDIFYYPDIVVTCDPRDTDRYFLRYPSLIIEVLSESTERIDRREKFLSFTHLETLAEYVLVAQDKMQVTLFRRSNNWQPELLIRPDQALQLTSLDLALALPAIYEGLKVN